MLSFSQLFRKQMITGEWLENMEMKITHNLIQLNYVFQNVDLLFQCFFSNYVLILHVLKLSHILSEQTILSLFCSHSYNKKFSQSSIFSEKHWGQVAPDNSRPTLVPSKKNRRIIWLLRKWQSDIHCFFLPVFLEGGGGMGQHSMVLTVAVEKQAFAIGSPHQWSQGHMTFLLWSNSETALHTHPSPMESQSLEL